MVRGSLVSDVIKVPQAHCTVAVCNVYTSKLVVDDTMLSLFFQEAIHVLATAQDQIKNTNG